MRLALSPPKASPSHLPGRSSVLTPVKLVASNPSGSVWSLIRFLAGGGSVGALGGLSC